MPPNFEGMRPVQMYTASLEWAEKIIKDTDELDELMRIADAYITKNTSLFAEYGESSLAKAY